MKITKLMSVLVLTVIAFLAGAVSHKMCLGPFCKGGLYRYTQKLSVDRESYIVSSQYGDLVARDVVIPDDIFGVNNYGSFFKIGDELLYIDQFGKILEWDGSKFLESAIPTPKLGAKLYEKKESISYNSAYGQVDFFGVRDAIVNGDNTKLYVSTHTYDNDCVNFVILVFDLTIDKGWDTLTTVADCLEGSLRASGGRLQIEGKDIFVSIGDYGHFREASIDERDITEALTTTFDRRKLSSLHKVDATTGETTLYAQGLRNVQGLLHRNSLLYSFEHGPDGGDELNIISQDNDYGWPYQTYGVQYGEETWPIQKKENMSFVMPSFTWVPSIAPSDVVSAENVFGKWGHGELIVSTLKNESLYILKLNNEGKAVISATQILIGHRIRNIEIYNNFLFLDRDLSNTITILELEK